MPITKSFAGLSALGFGILPGGAMESIATVTAGSSGSASILFDNIPSGFQHLQIRGVARSEFNSTGTDDISIRFNGDTGSNYATHGLYGDGATAAATATTSGTYLRPVRTTLVRDGQTASAYTGFVIDILDAFSTTKNKTVRGFGGIDWNGGGYVAVGSGLWLSTSAITSITLIVDQGSDYKQHSTFALYGLRAP